MYGIIIIMYPVNPKGAHNLFCHKLELIHFSKSHSDRWSFFYHNYQASSLLTLIYIKKFLQ